MVFVNHHLSGGVSCDEVPESETRGLTLSSQQHSALRESCTLVDANVCTLGEQENT